MDRKTRFWIGLFLIVLLYAFPIAAVILLQAVWHLIIVLAGLLLSVYLLHRFTIKKVKPKYPLLPPEGHPDIYTAARIPRPIYEDMEQYPWLFKKKPEKVRHLTKKAKKKH